MKKIIRLVLILLISVLMFLISYICYLQFSYYRIGDTKIDVYNNQENIVVLDNEYSITTYNIDVIDIDEIPDNEIHDNFYANGILAHNGFCSGGN